MLYPISLHMGISIGWHLPSPGRSMSMELIPVQQQVSQQSTRSVRTKFLAAGPIAATAAARAAGRGAGARLSPSLPPSRRRRGRAGRGAGGRRRSLQRPHGSCPGRHRPRPRRGSWAAGDGGTQVSIARAAPHRPRRRRREAGGQLRKRPGEEKVPPIHRCAKLTAGSPATFFSPGFHFCELSFHQPSSSSSSSPLPRRAGRAVPERVGAGQIRAITASTSTCPGRLFAAAGFSGDFPLPKTGHSSVLSRREVGIGLTECSIKEEEEEISKPLK